jgi:hypothetical protein
MHNALPWLVYRDIQLCLICVVISHFAKFIIQSVPNETQLIIYMCNDETKENTKGFESFPMNLTKHYQLQGQGRL